MPNTAAARAKALTAGQSTPVLVTSLIALEAQLAELEATSADAQALRLPRAWIIEALEHRFPEASAAVEQAFDTAPEDAEVDYVAVLLAAVPVSYDLLYNERKGAHMAAPGASAMLCGLPFGRSRWAQMGITNGNATTCAGCRKATGH